MTEVFYFTLEALLSSIVSFALFKPKLINIQLKLSFNYLGGDTQPLATY